MNIQYFPLILILFSQNLHQSVSLKLQSKGIMNLLKKQTQSTMEKINYQTLETFIKPTYLFVPFVKERDAMGRLIKNQSSSQTLIRMAKTETNSPNKLSPRKLKDRLQKNQDCLEQKIQKYFKNADVASLMQPSRQKKHKKTIIQLISQRPVTTITLKRPSKTASKQLSCLTTFTKSGTLKKAQSLFLPSNSKKGSMFMKRANSNILLPMRKSFQKQRKSISPQSPSKRNTVDEAKLKTVENQSKCPQLSRVRKMKQLQIKLQSDFEQRHSQFLDKLIKSKQMAFEVRVRLDKIDELC